MDPRTRLPSILTLKHNMLSLTSVVFILLVASAFILVSSMFVAASLPADFLGRFVSLPRQRRGLPILDAENAAPSVTFIPSGVVISRAETSTPVAVPKAQLEIDAEKPQSAITRGTHGYIYAPEVLPGRFPRKVVAQRAVSPLSNCTDETLNETIPDTLPSASDLASSTLSWSPSFNENLSELGLEPQLPSTQLVEVERLPTILLCEPRTIHVIPRIVLTPAPDDCEPSVAISLAKPSTQLVEAARLPTTTILLFEPQARVETRVIPRIVLTPAPYVSALDDSQPSTPPSPLSLRAPSSRKQKRHTASRKKVGGSGAQQPRSFFQLRDGRWEPNLVAEKQSTATQTVQRRGKENARPVRPSTPPKSKTNERYFRARGGRSNASGPKQRSAQALGGISEESEDAF